MTTERTIPGAFGSGEVRFVCDSKFTNVRLPGSISIKEDDFGSALVGSGRLPSLAEAPVSAWLLGRLAALAGSRFPFSYGQVLGSDGDDYWIIALAFSSSTGIKPVGSVSVLGSRSYVKLWIDATAPFSPTEVRMAFYEALVEKPTELGRAAITVVYTSFDDPAHGRRVPYTLGWDGKSFISRESPEHAVFPEDLE
jgi:hypothetical protein